MLHTVLYRKLNGELVGRDFNGNLYYQERIPLYSKNKRRWVVYKNKSRDGSSVPAMWHGWLHNLVDNTPENAFYDYNSDEANNLRKKMNTRNQTGTKHAYSSIKSKDQISVYKSWDPK